MMDVEKLKEAGINYEAGLKRFSGKAALYEKFLGKFADDTNFADLGKALEEGNADMAFRSSHTLKGIVGNLSMDTFYTDLCELVEILREGELAGTSEQYQKLAAEYKVIIDVLDAQ